MITLQRRGRHTTLRSPSSLPGLDPAGLRAWRDVRQANASMALLIWLARLLRDCDRCPHPWVNAALIELGPDIRRRIGSERRTGCDHGGRRQGRAFRCLLRVAGRGVERGHDAAAERLHLRERVLLAPVVRGGDRLANPDREGAGHELPGRDAVRRTQLAIEL